MRVKRVNRSLKVEKVNQSLSLIRMNQNLRLKRLQVMNQMIMNSRGMNQHRIAILRLVNKKQMEQNLQSQNNLLLSLER